MRIIKSAGQIILILCLTLACSNLLIFLFKKRHFTAVEPAELLTLCICILLCITLFFSAKQQHLTTLVKDYIGFIFPLFLIGLLNVLFYVFGHGYQVSDAKQYVYIVLFNVVCSIIIFSYLTFFLVDRRTVIIIFELITLLIAVTVFIDVFSPATFSEYPTRAAGLPENPNATSFRLASLLGLILFSEIPRPRKYFYLVIGSIAVFATFSRSGILLLGILLSLFAAKNFRYIKKEYFLKAGISVAVLLLFYQIITNMVNLPSLADVFSTQLKSERFEMITSGESYTNTEDSRAELAVTYFSKSTDKPIWGYGPRAISAMPIGPHNMFLLFWFELGIIGLFLYIYFIVNIFKWARKLQAIPLTVLGICVIANSLFSHHLMSEYFLLYISPLIFYYTRKGNFILEGSQV